MNRRIAPSFLAALLGLAGILLGLELVLRFLPVHEGFHSLPVNESSPMFRFEPNRRFQWSKFWDFSLRNLVRINNYGFRSDIDYDPRDPNPLLVVIGDSFVEAAMVPWAETGAGRLAELLEGRTRVYAFSAAGAPLSQYLAACEYARDTFSPDRIVIVIAENDFDESLLKYNRRAGFHYFAEAGDGSLNLVRADYTITPWRRLARKSRLAMYLYNNLNFERAHRGIERLTGRGIQPPSAGEELTADARRAVDAFLAMLPSKAGLPPSRILIVLDGLRPPLYNDQELAAAEASLFAVMRRYLMEEAQKRGLGVVDMQPRFREHFARTGERLEFERDSHWNSAAHGLFARAVADWWRRSTQGAKGAREEPEERRGTGDDNRHGKPEPSPSTPGPSVDQRSGTLPEETHRPTGGQGGCARILLKGRTLSERISGGTLVGGSNGIMSDAFRVAPLPPQGDTGAV